MFYFFKLFHWIYYFYNKFRQKRSLINLKNLKNCVDEDGYSFQGFTETNKLFIHIPKCAGVSINNLLYNNLGGGHRSILFYMAIFNPKEFNKLYKFTVLREPIDRFESAYYFLKSGGFKNELDLRNKELFIDKSVDINDFILNYFDKNLSNKLIHFKSQSKFICVFNKVIVDKIYLFDKIENLCQDLNINLNVLDSKNLNKTYYRHKIKLNELSINKLKFIYKKDFDLYNSHSNN